MQIENLARESAKNEWRNAIGKHEADNNVRRQRLHLNHGARPPQQGRDWLGLNSQSRANSMHRNTRCRPCPATVPRESGTALGALGKPYARDLVTSRQRAADQTHADRVGEA